MITAWDVYWITRLDVLNFAFGGMLSISVILGICLPFAYGMAEDCGIDVLKRLVTKVGVPLIIVFVIVGGFGKTFTPTTKEACAIYLIPKIVNNEQVQKIPNNFAKLTNVKMEEWINESIIDKKETK